MKQEDIEMPEYLNASYEGDDLYTGDQVRELMKLVAAKKHEELYRLAEEAPVRGDARETRQNILHAIRLTCSA